MSQDEKKGNGIMRNVIAAKDQQWKLNDRMIPDVRSGGKRGNERKRWKGMMMRLRCGTR
jgi:hypothetical protein